MIRATQLDGRAVIKMDAAEKLGRVEEIIRDRPRIRTGTSRNLR